MGSVDGVVHPVDALEQADVGCRAAVCKTKLNQKFDMLVSISQEDLWHVTVNDSDR